MTWKRGDRVVHSGRPEWGVGEVIEAASDTQDGRPCQRLSVRFGRAGLKTISTAFATLEPAEARAAIGAATNGWLPTPSDERPEEIMTRLPEAATDPFSSAEARLKATCSLFRFSTSGPSLIDWAVTQSGLNDPLSRFNRHELEQFFERFRFNLDQHYRKLAAEVRKRDPKALETAIASAPPEAQRVLRTINIPR